ncbi:MAG: methyl-accepting chemotaxis protein [Zoogloeaceae bacterium]|jgi:methyl-accepting chemotaxis protein|nr:methyl-accepting chemotaxis protein [Zoogloeaceae bacterium]
MLTALRRLPLAQQTLVGILLICVVAAVIFSFILSAYTRNTALEESQNTLKTQTDLIARTLEYAEESMKQDALTALEQFERELPSARLSGNTVEIAGAARPELMFGNVRGIGNQAFLLGYKARNPAHDVAFLLRDGNDIYRATTLLKDTGGRYRDGERVADDYARSLLEGKLYLGAIQRSGKMYALAAKPLKDERGEVIGAITTRVSIEENVKTLKERLGSIAIGKTGYPFIISEAAGDSKEARFVMHPQFEDKNISEVDAQFRAVLTTILEQKNGFLSYAWQEADGRSRQKIAVFDRIPELRWIIVASAPEDEFTAPYDNIRRLLLLGLAITVILLVVCLFWLIRWQLRPIDRVARELTYMGRGDLTHQVEIRPDSRNEIDGLALRVNETRNAMKSLVGAIRGSAEKVTESAADAFESLRQLSSSITGLASSSTQMNSSIEEFSSAIEHIAQSANAAHDRVSDAVNKVENGKQVVGQVIHSIQAIETRVQSSLSEVETLTEHSRQIEKVVATISTIAGQTNLLALNAAIEAARAGEVGRGFAVVADEVRKLAEQSAHSADEIGSILGQVTTGVTAVRAAISEVVNETRNGTEFSGVAGVALEAIDSITRDIASAVTSIAEATRQQVAASQMMTQQINASAEATEETENVTRDVSQNAADLKTEAEKLNREVGHFVVE